MKEIKEKVTIVTSTLVKINSFPSKEKVSYLVKWKIISPVLIPIKHDIAQFEKLFVKNDNSIPHNKPKNRAGK